ncbi:TIR domain-containing protein [Chryseobacterium polytrichastri]|uniref:Tetratricopeptide repeat-containing protein n=1 Tax=Chryseobacterium polytrichastri TaxID=1302687 RepID=A0A1M6TA13_9FLAO|nr:TIR domain-containing protein [Chryseobacterium polytrichastri]SHK53823.1 Tetratricopeptide repeat-containing protein [Chryseobacterium polytrichastri]
MRKPKLFVGSSVEGLSVAYAIQDNLQYTSECTVWDQGVFNLSESSLESLIKTLNESDFGVFVFTPDDYIKIRGKSHLAIRDNVLFELGLFIGRLGRERSFIVVPDNKTFHLPTDLIGLTPAKYEATRSDNNLRAGTGSASHNIRDAINKLGVLDKSTSNSELEQKSETQSDASKQVSWVEDYIINKDYDTAIKKISAEIKKEKDILNKLNLKGCLCDIEYTKNPLKGVELYEKFISTNINSSIPYQHFASTLIQNNLIAKALEIIERGIKNSENKIRLSIMKANCLSSLDKDNDAIKFLQEQKNILNSPEFQLKLASLLDKTGQKNEALLEYLDGYKLDPKNEKLLSEFAKVCYDTDHKKVSLLLYQDLVNISKDNSTYWTLMGNSYMDLDFYNSALQSYEKANELSEGKQAWILANIGNLYNNKKFYKKAENHLNESLKIENKSDYTLNRLSQVYKSINDEEEKINEILKEAKVTLNNEFKKDEIKYEDNHKSL